MGRPSSPPFVPLSLFAAPATVLPSPSIHLWVEDEANREETTKRAPRSRVFIGAAALAVQGPAIVSCQLDTHVPTRVHTYACTRGVSPAESHWYARRTQRERYGVTRERRDRDSFSDCKKGSQPASQPAATAASTAIASDGTLPPIAEGTRLRVFWYPLLLLLPTRSCPLFSEALAISSLRRVRFDCRLRLALRRLASPRLASPEAARDTADGCRQGDRGTRYLCTFAGKKTSTRLSGLLPG